MSDRLVILEGISDGVRSTASINRRTDIFDICREDGEVQFIVLGFAEDGIDANKQLRENPPPKNAD